MSTTEAMLRLLPALLIVLGALWAAKRFGQRGTGRESGPRVLGRTPLSRGAHLATVDVGGRVLVLGVTDRQVNVVAELDRAGQPGGAGLAGTVPLDPSTGAATEPAAPAHRPRTGLIDRLRWMTSRRALATTPTTDRHVALRAQVEAALPPDASPTPVRGRHGALVEQLAASGSRGTRLVPRGS